MTIPPSPDPLAFDSLLSRSWALFRRNWIVALPALIAFAIALLTLAVIAAVFLALLAGSRNFNHLTGAAIGVLVFGYLAFAVVAIAGALWAIVATYGMADAAWVRGVATFADGFAAFRHRTWPAVVAFIGITGLAIAAFILALPTLGLALLALPIVTMYAIPAVVAGGRGGFEAIGESFRLVRSHFVPSLITIIVLLGIQYAIGMIGGIAIVPLQFSIMPTGSDSMPHMPPIPLLVGSAVGYLISLVAGIAYSGFYAIALVGMYRNLAAHTPPAGARIVAG